MGYDSFLQILGQVQPYIRDYLERRDSNDSHTACAPHKQLLDEMERLKMENDKLRMEAARREKSHIQLKSSQGQVATSHRKVKTTFKTKKFKTENEMLRKQKRQQNQGGAESDRAGIPDSRLDTGQKIALQCSKVQLDAARANTGWCRVNREKELVNRRPVTQHRYSGRLWTYRGTCASTPIPLPPSPSTVTPAPHTPQYWEVHSRVGVMGGGLWWLVLEVGVVEESQVDSKVYGYRQRRSWCVSVWSCETHVGRICTRVWQQGEVGECYSNIMSDKRSTQATLHYGVVLDVGRGRLSFIDLDREVVLAKVDVEWRESLLPMYGVGRSDYCTVNMKVISGADITMTDTKKSLIYDALN